MLPHQGMRCDTLTTSFRLLYAHSLEIQMNAFCKGSCLGTINIDDSSLGHRHNQLFPIVCPVPVVTDCGVGGLVLGPNTTLVVLLYYRNPNMWMLLDLTCVFVIHHMTLIPHAVILPEDIYPPSCLS